MHKAHILIAEDDRNIRRGLCDALESEGYTTSQAADGQQALDSFNQQSVDLVLLDIMMPEKSGYDVCRALRQNGNDVPVILLTAKGEEIDKVVGLQLGADDYITKPFGMHELLARVDAVLRRCRRAPAPHKDLPEPPATYRFGEVEIDRRKYTARAGKKTHALTARELKLLDVFYAQPGDVLTRDDLLNTVWGMDYFGTTRTLDQHIAQLRKKIEKNPGSPQHIQTVHGVGYRYVANVDG